MVCELIYMKLSNLGMNGSSNISHNCTASKDHAMLT